MAANTTPPQRPPVLSHICAIALVAGCAVFGMAGPRVRAQEARPVFRARTEMVRLDVTVTDSDGRPVADLRPDELRITENGRPRPILLFRHLTDAPPDGERPRPTFEEVSRNELAQSGHVYVLVFDQLHIAVGHEQRARLAAERFLSERLKPGDAVAIYGLPGPGPAVNLTTDLIHARATLQQVRGRARSIPGGLSEAAAYRVARSGPAGADVQVTRPIDLVSDVAAPALTAASGPEKGSVSEFMRERASAIVAQADMEGQIFLGTLAGVMRKLRWVDGRKAFILFSEGFVIENLTRQLEQVASAAAQSQSIVYAIDVGNSSGAGAERIILSDPLATLALETNGRLVRQGADLDKTLARIAAETEDYYLIGFEPLMSDTPQDYHRVKVNVTRRGVTVRARTGYSTAPEASPLADRQAIDVALTLPRVSSALPIEYTTYERSGPVPDKPRVIISATAQVPCCQMPDQAATVVFIVRDAVTGQAVASGTDHVPMPLPAEAGPGHLDPIHYSVQFDVPPGEYWMRMLVREPGGVIGTADRRFHVWSLDGGALATSDLIVARLDGPRFDAPTRATVSRADEVLAYLEVYGSAAAIQAADARVEVLRGDSNEVVATADAVVKSGSRGERIVRARLPVAKLTDGSYVARVRIAAPNQAPRTVIRNFVIANADTSSQ